MSIEITTPDGTVDLDTLLDLLVEIGNEMPEGTRIDEVIDLTSLPTFGGDEPSDTQEIWSWDAERLLVIDSWPVLDWKIINRADSWLPEYNQE